jgi:outer membrane protein assembly factor BamB
MKTLHTVLVLFSLAPVALTADWPQFLGPNRDGHSKDTGLLKAWPKGGPMLAWTFANAGVGYSSPAVVGDRIYLLGGRGKDDELFCLDAANGLQLWKQKIGQLYDFDGNQWGGGPRATPSVADGLVYALGGFGDLLCADAKTGDVVWRVSMAKDLKGEVNKIGGNQEKLGWGYSWSPLVDGDKLICYPGGPEGAVAALDRKKGTVLWRSTDLKEQASYASPIVAEIGGVRQYIVLHNGGLAGVEAKNGKVLWSWEKEPAYGDVVIPTPLFKDGCVYLSAGYKPATCDLIQINENKGKFTAKNLYERDVARVMKNSVAGSVIVDGHVYGYSDRVGWVCQELKTGKLVWGDKRAFKVGSVSYADGRLYCYGEDDGIVALVEPSPTKWVEHGRFNLPRAANLKAISGRNWTPPVIANGHLFIRDQELLFCYKIK